MKRGNRNLLAGFAAGMLLVALPLSWTGFKYRHVLRALRGMGNTPELKKTADEIIAGKGIVTRKVFFSSKSLGQVTDMARGRFDSAPGSALAVAGTQGAVFLDPTGNSVSSVRFPARYSLVRILPQGDGKECRFFDEGAWGSSTRLLDHSGRPAWDHVATGVDSAAAGDLDGDGRDEFALGFNGSGGLQLLDDSGSLRWKEEGANLWHVEMGPTETGGPTRLIHSNAKGHITIRDKNGKTLSSVSCESYVSEFALLSWPAEGRPALVYASRDWLVLSDMKGRTLKKLWAPGVDYVDLMRTSYIHHGGKSFLAVLASRGYLGSHFYLYDEAGGLIYGEHSGERWTSLGRFELDGRESLLLGGDGKVWQIEPGAGIEKASVLEPRGKLRVSLPYVLADLNDGVIDPVCQGCRMTYNDTREDCASMTSQTFTAGIAVDGADKTRFLRWNIKLDTEHGTCRDQAWVWTDFWMPQQGVDLSKSTGIRYWIRASKPHVRYGFSARIFNDPCLRGDNPLELTDLVAPEKWTQVKVPWTRLKWSSPSDCPKTFRNIGQVNFLVGGKSDQVALDLDQIEIY